MSNGTPQLDEQSRRPRIVIIGAGAAGALAALHLIRDAQRRSTAVDLLLIDPVERWARGTAFGTCDERHLLNVPAAGMSALPQESTHFVEWRTRQEKHGTGNSFAPRAEWGRYLDDTLCQAREQAGGLVTLEHRRTRALGICRRPDALAVVGGSGEEIPADAVVIATGLPAAGSDWAPPGLRESPYFVPDPWAAGALDRVRRDQLGSPDVLVVGTGLTMVDALLSLTGAGNGPDRVVHAVSRSGRLPAAHRAQPRPAIVPDVSGWGSGLAEMRAHAWEHVDSVRRSCGDWRPAVDGLRCRLATLWQRLNDDDRQEFLVTDAGRWNLVRHRMAPSSAAHIRALRRSGRLDVRCGQVVDAAPHPSGSLRVRFDDGGTLDVGWVINCTGPRSDIRTLGNPLLNDLLRPREGGTLATLATAALGVRTENGRLLNQHGRADAPLWTLGALRRGELWESTAVPEISTQAQALAVDVLDAVTVPGPRVLVVNGAPKQVSLAGK